MKISDRVDVVAALLSSGAALATPASNFEASTSIP
jgi:hypothetical protein